MGKATDLFGEKKTFYFKGAKEQYDKF